MRRAGGNRAVCTTAFPRFLSQAHAGYAVVAVLAIDTFLVLTACRALDDNMLTSWRWVFSAVHPTAVTPVLAAGIALAYALSRVSLPERFFAPFLFFTSFIAATLFWRTPEVIVDASRYFTQARHLEAYGVGYFFAEWGRGIAAWTDMPLVPFLYGVIFKVFGEARVYIQLFTTLLFAATVVLTYRIGRELWSETAGFYGGLFLLAIPYLFTQVPLMLVDVPTMFFVTLALYSFLLALTRGGVRYGALAAVALCLALFSKYSAVLVLPVLGVALFVCLRDGPVTRRAVLRRAGAVVLVAGLLAGAVVAAKLDVISGQVELLRHYQQPGLSRWGESFYSTLLFQVHPFLTVAALYSLYAAMKRRDARYAVACSFVLLMVVLQVERIRYVMMAFPALALMASYGLQEIRDGKLRRFIALSAVASSLTIALFAYTPFLQGISAANVKNAGEYVNATGSGPIEVVALPARGAADINPAIAVPILDLFTARDIIYRYDRPSPGTTGSATSSLRFTWEYRNPAYYAPSDEVPANTVVVISGSPDEPLPGSIAERISTYRLSKAFTASTGIFRYQTIVRVYEKEE